MSLVGYARVSSTGQSVELQVAELIAAGCAPDDVFAETRTGTTTKGRAQLEAALRHVRRGDVLLVTRLDRLARSATDLWGIVEKLQAKQVGLRVLQQGEFDTTTSAGKMLLQIIAVFAEFETSLRRERQLEGIVKAKAEGRYRGRPKIADAASRINALADEGKQTAEIVAALGYSRSTVQRVLRARRRPTA